MSTNGRGIKHVVKGGDLKYLDRLEVQYSGDRSDNIFADPAMFSLRVAQS
jgi:hypothetical protein